MAKRNQEKRKEVYQYSYRDYRYGDGKSEITLTIDPDNIAQLVTIACSAVGSSKFLIELVKLWFDHRKNKKIKIRKGDIEIEIQGDISLNEVEQRIEQFKKMTKGMNDDIKIIQ